MKPILIDVYSLPEASNICDQTLREVISLDKFSMAHVIMEKDAESLLHKHSIMTEIYFILEGEGILTYGNKALKAKKGVNLVIYPETLHKLKNTGNSKLEHLVFALPPFDPTDIEIINGENLEIKIESYKPKNGPVESLDGALIQEYISQDERNKLGIAIALGTLQKNRTATSHYHKISEEIYYVVSGEGIINIGGKSFQVKKGSVAYIPTNNLHSLENNDNSKLEVLCISSPPYKEEDFLTI